MTDSTSTGLFVFLICFWLCLAMFSSYFNVELSKSNIQDLLPSSMEKDQSIFKGFFETITGVLEDIPVVKFFVPLFKILTFQYSDSIPALLSIFLDATLIFTAYIGFSMFFKGK